MRDVAFAGIRSLYPISIGRLKTFIGDPNRPHVNAWLSRKMLLPADGASTRSAAFVSDPIGCGL